MQLTTTATTMDLRSDAAILDDVQRGLDSELFAEVAVTVVSGRVTIEGKVDSWSERRNLAALAAQVADVHEVVNRLVVGAAPVGEMTLRIAIEHALACRAMREARRIDVAISGRRVTVSGQVGSQSEHDAVLGSIVGIPGVDEVDDELRVG